VITQAPSLRLLTPLASLLLAVAAVAWVGVVVLARDMGSMPGTMGLGVISFIAVWALMMAAMMLPSVTPFASLYMRTFGDDHGWRLAGFASGYLIVWIAGALPAYGLAWLADRLVGVKLGAYQGRTRDLRVGLYHGAFCLACCWALMALLVAFGLMNVIAMVVLAGSVLVEKTWVWGPRFSRLLGVAALGLALAAIFVPGLAPGLHQAPSPDGMGGM
jgi:predicted metal-binding membrane protein